MTTVLISSCCHSHLGHLVEDLLALDNDSLVVDSELLQVEFHLVVFLDLAHVPHVLRAVHHLDQEVA